MQATFTALLTATTLSLMLLGCGPAGEPPATTAEPEPPATTIRGTAAEPPADTAEPDALTADTDPPAPPEPTGTEPPATETLVLVGGEPITRAELDLALERIDSADTRAPDVDQADLERRLLLSLVDARALAQLAERELPADELHRLDLRARAYREELLVQRYLSTHARPDPVPWSLVQDYYNEHPEEFGATREVSFELVRTRRALSGPQRDAAIQALAGLDAVDDWQAWTLEQPAALQLDYRTTTARPELLEQPLRTLVEGTAAGDTSAIGPGELLMRLRVTDDRQTPPRPLDEVSAEIRRRLAPLQLRDVIRELAEQARTTLGVRYAEAAQPPTITGPDSADATLNQTNGASPPAQRPDPQ